MSAFVRPVKLMTPVLVAVPVLRLAIDAYSIVSCVLRPTTVMLIPSPDKGQVSQQPLLRYGTISEAGPSEAPPPSFEESVGHLVIDIDGFPEPFPEGGEEPPEFTPYDAEHWVSKNGEIISHDPHLNEDGAWSSWYALMLCSYISFRPYRRSALSFLAFTGRDTSDLPHSLPWHAQRDPPPSGRKDRLAGPSVHGHRVRYRNHHRF